LSELQIGLKATKHLLRSQQIKESKIRRYSEELEILQQRVKETEKRNKMLNEEIKDKETLTLHSHQLHQQIGIKDNEIQSQVERLQLLEQQLEYKQLECQRLEEELRNVKKKAELDKDCLKRSNKQHKDKAWQSEKSLESLNIQIDHLNSELEVEKSRCSRLVREKAAIESSAQSLRIQLKEVQDAVNEYQRKLSIKTRDASALQLENEQNKTVIGTLEEQLKGNETVTNSRIMSAQTDIRELQCAVTQYESLISDYKSQLEKSHKEIDRLVQEIHKKDMEIEQLQHDSYMELEKSKIAYHKQLTDMEPLTDHLKTTELKLQESEEKLSVYEQRYTDQTRTIADLTAKAASADSLKERLQEKKIECKSAGAKIEMFEKRIRDMEGQNKELIMITSRKEELVKQLQLKEENYIEEIGSLNRQLDGIKCDSKRQMESLREKCDLKEKSHMSRQMDMETQLKRVNGQLDQMKKSKDENERKLQHKVKELQERLDHCQATKKALESYLSFIKSSYASIFNDTSMPLDTWSSPITQ
jgi:outer dense fiber protein 2